LIHAVTLDPVTLTPNAVETSIVTPHGEYNLGPRIDYQLNAKNTLTGRYQYSFGTSDNNGIGQYTLLSNGYSSENRSQDLQLTDTTVLSPTAVNDLRFQYARNTSRDFGSNEVATVNVTDAFVGGGAQVGRSSNTSQRYEFQDNTSIAHRAHTFRFGARVRHETLSDDSPANFGGTFTFFGVAAAPLLDAANNAVLDPSTGLAKTAPIGSLEQYRRTLLFQGMGLPAAQIRALGGGASQFSIAGGNPVASVSQTDMGVYGQDDWRVKPNLTVSVGLRYETQTNIHDWHDLSPRLGIAWAPKPQNGKPPKIVIRAGFGAYYDRVNSNLTLRQLRFDGVNQQQLLVVNPDSSPTFPRSLR
jgi:outer membrane receptor protein involved in Fe transport